MSGAVLGKGLLAVGLVLVVLGVWILFVGRLPSLLSWFGRLPGDVYIERNNLKIYLPIMTGVLLSVFLTGIIWLFSRRG